MTDCIARHWRVLSMAVSLLAFCSTSRAQPDDQFIARHAAALNAGEVALELEKYGPVTHVDTAIVIDAEPQTIWDILVACEIAPDYVPNVVACRSLQIINEGRAELFIQTVKPAFFIPAFEHVFRMDYERWERIVISRVSGPIRQLNSTWNLEPRTDGSILLTYTLQVDPGIPIPRLFVRQTLRRDLPRVLEGIRTRAESMR